MRGEGPKRNWAQTGHAFADLFEMTSKLQPRTQPERDLQRPMGPWPSPSAVLSEQTGLDEGVLASPARVPLHLLSSDRRRDPELEGCSSSQAHGDSRQAPVSAVSPSSLPLEWPGSHGFYRDDSKAQERDQPNHVAF